jgi:hypothetical protein
LDKQRNVAILRLPLPPTYTLFTKKIGSQLEENMKKVRIGHAYKKATPYSRQGTALI